MIANLAGADIRPGLDGSPAARASRSPSSPAVATAGRPCATATVEVIDEPGVDGELALRPGWPSMFRGYLHDEERYARVLRRRLVPHRRRRPPRRRRLAVVRRPRRRRDQVRRPPHRSVRGRERADGAPRRRRGRRDRRARPGGRRGRQGVRDPRDRATSRARTCASSCSASPAAGSAPPSRRATIAFDQHLPKTKSGKIMRRLLQGPRARPARGRPVHAGAAVS